MKETMLTIQQVAAKLQVSSKTVRRLASAGELKRINVATTGTQPRWRYTEASLTRFINRRRRQA